MRIHNVTDPVYAPNSYGGPAGRSRSARTTAAPGTPTARWCAPRTRCAPEDDDWGQAGTMVREVLDDAARAPAGRQHRRPPAQRRQRADPAARLRVLAQRRQGPRRPDRGRRPRQAGRDGPQGRRAGQPGPGERAGQGLTARRGVHHHPLPARPRPRLCPRSRGRAPSPRDAPMDCQAPLLGGGCASSSFDRLAPLVGVNVVRTRCAAGAARLTPPTRGKCWPGRRKGRG